MCLMTIIRRQKIMTFQLSFCLIISLKIIYTVTVTLLYDTKICFTERTVAPWTACTFSDKSLPEISLRHRGRHLIGGYLREQRFSVAFATKWSPKKRRQDTCEHAERLEALPIENEVLTRATEV